MKLSEKVEDYISDTMNYDMDELMERLVENIDEMKCSNGQTTALDECCVNWGDYYVMDLDDYTKKIFKEVVDRVINVIKSFEEEDNECH
jgi:hypothetical protein